MFLKLELGRTTGIEKAVKTYQNLTPEERMDIELKETEAKTEWVTSPTPRDEEQEMNDRVFREGFLERPPETELQDEKEQRT